MTSPGWSLPSTAPTLSLSEIIAAEKYEKRKIKKQIKEDFNLAKHIATIDNFDESSQIKKDPAVFSSSTASGSSSAAPYSSAIKCEAPCSSKTADYLDSIDLPNDNHSTISGSSLSKAELDDRKISELLQAEFDLEYDEELKRIENARNKNSKISVSFAKYRLYPDDMLQNDSDKEDEDEVDKRRQKNWDRFEENQKEISKIGKSGYFEDEDGKIRTKHDIEMTGRKNAGKVMEFHSDFSSGDCANFDMKINNKVFNELRKYAISSAKKNNQISLDRQENVKTSEMGMDQKTRLLLYKLINTHMVLENIDGIISKGKEAVVLHGEGNVHHEKFQIPKEVAVKIFSTTLNEFKQRDRYIKDDFRFNGQLKQNNRNIINSWCEKEFHNLNRLKKAEIPCPSPITFRKHILVMSFIGNGHENPAPKLKDVKLSTAEMICAYDEVVDIMKRMYHYARIIHADFSEYNILYHEGKLYVIDLATGVEPCHPCAFEFLMRDCHNITTFFEKHQVPVKTKEELFFEITKLDPLTTNMSMLEKIHMKGEAAHVVTTPRNLDDEERERLPEEFRLKEFPFDYAWKKVEELKLKNEKKSDNSDDEEEDDEDWTEVSSKKKVKHKCIIDNETSKMGEEIMVKNC